MASNTLAMILPANIVRGAFAQVVQTAARPDRLVFTDEGQGDRLLWFHPELRGRISYDARAETMTANDLDALASLYGTPNAPQIVHNTESR